MELAEKIQIFWGEAAGGGRWTFQDLGIFGGCEVPSRSSRLQHFYTSHWLVAADLFSELYYFY